MPNSKSHNIFLTINFAVIIGFVILTLGFDFLDKIEIFYGIDFPKLNRFLKAAVGVYAIIFIIFHMSYLIGKLKYLIYTTASIVFIFALKYNYWDVYIEEFFRYTFIFIFYAILHFSYHATKHREFLRLFYKVLKAFMIINLAAILIGLFLEVHVFKTYQYGRFGYNGLLLSQGLTPYVYLAAMAMFWTRKDFPMLAVLFFASAFSGIKGVYFGEFILLILLVFFDKNFSKEKKLKIGLVCVVTFIVALVVIFSSQTFKEVIDQDGIIAAIFSYRIENFIEIMETNPVESYNVFIGATGLQTVRLEMQLIDILLFFGILGIVIYTYFMVSVYKDIVKSSNAKAFFVSALILSLLSGNLFYIPLAIVLFFLTLIWLNEESIQKNQKT